MVELPIAVYNCERIILSKLVCSGNNIGALNSCIIYFNGTPVKYTRLPHLKKMVFFVDGILNNIKSFHLIGPCNVKFMIDFQTTKAVPVTYNSIRFLLHLSLEMKAISQRAS